MKNYGEQYYLYRHVRIDKNEPFYIGVGRKYYGKIYKGYYRAKTQSKRNKLWRDIVSKTSYEIEIILESDNLEFVKRKEIEFIALYGRKNLGTGILANLTDGGDGCESLVFTVEQRKRMADRSKGNKNMFGKKHSLESKMQMSNSSKTKRKVVQKTLSGELVKVYDSIKETDSYGFISTNVHACCTKKRETHKKFKWEYYDN